MLTPDAALALLKDGNRMSRLHMFGKIKDWCRIQTRYDRCAHNFMSTICIAATVIFWPNQ